MQILYDDGEEEQLRIGLGIPVRVDLQPGEELPNPPIAFLERLVNLITDEAAALGSAAAVEQVVKRKRQMEQQGKATTMQCCPATCTPAYVSRAASCQLLQLYKCHRWFRCCVLLRTP